MKKKICIITGSRAEYGLLKNIMTKIDYDKDLKLQIVVTGMHTSEKYGNTYKNILDDGFHIDKIIPMNLNHDSPQSIIKECGQELSEFADVFNILGPDMVIVLGDRYEILIGVYAALIFKIPIAHLCGGDITEHAYDDSIRHAITKMSHLHFTTHESSNRRVIQMGESLDRVFCYGNPGLEDLYEFRPLNKEKLCQKLDIKFNTYNFLVVYHPVTLDNDLEKDIKVLLNIFEYYLELGEYNIFIILPNCDNDNNIIFENFIRLNQKFKECFLFKSLIREDYLSLAKYIDVFIGNSSSGIYEMPLLQIPVLNLGNRQKGRLLSNGIISSQLENEDVLKQALSDVIKIKDIKPIYQSYETSKLVVQKIKTFLKNHSSVKVFHNI